MFKWFKKKKISPQPAASPERVTREAGRRPIQQYVYPPVANGIPRFPVPDILGEHEDLIQRIRDLSEHKSIFDERYWAVIERFADYVYLLPASESHHHRGAGGLLCHGLETAKYVLQQSYDRLHGMDMSPQKRKAARERWLFANFIAGLIHDIGKTAADMWVFSVSGTIWDLFSKPLALWFQDLPPQEDRIYVSWRREGQDHRRMTIYLMNHILQAGDLAYLHEVEPILIDHIHQAILGEKGPRNFLTEMVQEADKKSVALDLQKSNMFADLGPQVRQPLARHYVMAMQRLVMEDRWRVNEPGSVLWVMRGAEVYLVWPEMAQDITKLLQQDGTPGVPSSPEVLAEILQDHGLLVLASNGNRLWRLWPSVVDVGEEGLLALRLKEPLYIMDLVPPSVPGEVWGEGEKPPVKAEPPGNRSRESTSGTLPSFSPPSLGILEEPTSPQDPETLAELQEYFAGGGLGGLALMKFAAEVSVDSRRDGKDYRTGPQMLLAWGERKFTEEGSLSEVIESLARAGWLVLDGNRRVHEEPGFGKCLKLQERETALLWLLVRFLGEANSLESGVDVPLAGENTDHHKDGFTETHPQEAVAGSSPESPATLVLKGEDDWVSEVAAILDRDGPVDYERVKELVATRTGNRRGIFQLVYRYFEVGNEGGKMVVLRRI
jgi:conjugal transfer pilus assembly protein TraI